MYSIIDFNYFLGRRIAIKSVFLLLTLQFLYSDEFYYFQNNKKITLTPIIEEKALRSFSSPKESNISYYRTQEGRTIGIRNEILLKLTNPLVLERIVKRYPVEVKRSLSGNLYLLKVTPGEDTLKVCNRIRKETGVLYAHPNLIKKIHRR